MNEAVKVPNDGLLTTAELAALPDFTLGQAAVSPSGRTIAGPGGTADVEPRVMQVLVVLASAAGQVVTRERLFDRCWGGIYVGDDSLNRAVGAVRKFATDIAGGSFAIETIPKTGYRLTGKPIGLPAAEPQGRAGISRRGATFAGIGLAFLAGGGIWWRARFRENSRFDELIEGAESAIRTEDAGPPVLRPLEEAVALRPGSARAWGLLAFFNSVSAQLAEPKDAAAMVTRAQGAARRAFSIDQKEPNALLAMFELEGSTLDWFTRDQRLRRIIAIDPTRIWAIAELVLMLQAAGMNRESRYWNERAIALVPLSLDYLTKRAFKLWIAGRVAEADKVIDQVRALYPTNDWAWWARFLIYAMTGRVPAARTMLNSNPKMLPGSADAAMWRTALPALDEPSAAAIRLTREACVHAAQTDAQTYGPAVMILSQLGDVDGAFAIANGSLLSRGPIIRPEKPDSKDPGQNAIDRVNMQWMFTPPCKSIRADPRFGPLCDDIGLTEYWRRRGVQPDYRLTER